MRSNMKKKRDSQTKTICGKGECIAVMTKEKRVYFKDVFGMDTVTQLSKRVLRIIPVFLCTLPMSVVWADETVFVLEDIVVTATRTPHTLRDVPVETVVISKEDIERMNSQNIMDILNDVPGFHTAYHDDIFGTYTWEAKMRGMDFNSGYGLFLIDGQRAMGCGQSGGMGEYGVGLNQIPVNMIERVEVVKGPGSALYGSDAMAGVINIITKKAPDKGEGWAGVSYGSYDVKRSNGDGSEEEASGDRNMSQVYVGYGDRISDRMGYLLHYNYEGADDISEDPLKSDRHSFMGKWDAQLADSLDLYTKLELSGYQKVDSRKEDSYRISLGADWQPDEQHTIAIKGYTYKWDFVHGYPGYSYGYKNGYVGYDQGEIQYTWFASKSNTLTGGGEIQEQGIDYTIENADGSIVTVDEDVRTASLYLQDEIVLFEKFTLIGGARFDDHSVFGSEINPKFSTMVRLRDTTTLRASVGRSFKSPTIRQLYYDVPYRHGGWYAQSNRDLEPETAIGYTVSIEQFLREESIRMNLGYFRNNVDNMVISVDTGELYDGLPLMRYQNVEKAWTQGVEFMCHTCLSDRLSASLSYTYTDTEDEETGKELTYVPTHSVSLSPTYAWEEYGLGMSATISYNGEQYTDSGNTEHIDAATVMDVKIYKHLSENAKLSLKADDVFDSDEGREGTYHAGRAFSIKLEFAY